MRTILPDVREKAGGKMSEDLAVYKLITSEIVDEFHWENGRFYVWVPYGFLKEFVDGLSQTFGYGIFDEEGIRAYLKDGCVCIDLWVLENYLELEEIFPR